MDTTSLPAYLFHQGTNFYSYNYLGAHKNNDGSWTFRVWAPGAERIFLVGDFNGWQETVEMIKNASEGVFEITVCDSALVTGMNYKYKIYSSAGAHYKADPYAFYSETNSGTASKLYCEPEFMWDDGKWLDYRARTMQNTDGYSVPLNIYEMHLGSWRTRDGRTTKNQDAYLNYREIADMLVPYLKKMGYTHAELMPIMEHPFDGSWGYQVCGYFAPTSRYGTPDDFRYFVNKLHRNGLGVILDWVPAHFPKDEHGLCEFDGSPLYEYQGADRMENKDWGTRCFDVGRNEVESFLISNAIYWFSEFHIDGLRIDAVASMLYLDYGRQNGDWVPNIYGGKENLESVAFFKKLNSAVRSGYPDVMMIAEESTSWPKVTEPAENGGLGFTLKWNMGWMNDILNYVSADTYFRQNMHSALTFPLVYAFSERFVLPISHDEIVHGKRSLIDKMFGKYEDKFAQDRCFMAYMMSQPGKKLLFMGCEFAQFREWDFENQLEWFMLDFDMHRRFQDYTAALNHFYLENRSFWENDFSWDGYEWICADDNNQNTIVYKRKSRGGKNIICCINFGTTRHVGYIIGVKPGDYREVFNSDDKAYGGNGFGNSGVLKAKKQPAHGQEYSIAVNIAPRSAVYIARDTKKISKLPKSK